MQVLRCHWSVLYSINYSLQVISSNLCDWLVGNPCQEHQDEHFECSHRGPSSS
jgi:hypothetical protein